MRRATASIAVGAALTVSVLAVAPARADNATCSYSPAGIFLPALVAVSLTPNAGHATALEPISGGELRVLADNGTDSFSMVDCGAGTLTNTDLILITDGSPGGRGDLRPHSLAVGQSAFYGPGASDESGGSDEIEFGVGLGPGEDHLLLDQRGEGAATIRLGAEGQNRRINLNAAEQSGIDWDVQVSGVDELTFSGGNGSDDVRGSGGAGTGDAPFPIRIDAGAAAGDDRLVGGAAGDRLIGGDGGDILTGGHGMDGLIGKTGGDQIVGGAQRDMLTGAAGSDTMRGGRGRDWLNGGPGGDLLVGGPGKDRCFGGGGHDLFLGCELLKQ